MLHILVLCAGNLSAQAWAEWFRQKATQRKYLVQQIAALHVYSSYVSTGYSIAKKGLGTIIGIKNDDLDQHRNYLASLAIVSPRIKQYRKVADIIALHKSIAKQSGNAIKSFRKNLYLTPKEIGYLQGVFDALLSDCLKNLDILLGLVTKGNLTMKDDERIMAIDKIYIDMQDKQEFVRAFNHSAAGLSIQRDNEGNQIIIAKKLNGLK